MHSFDYIAPGSVEEAIAVLERQEGAQLFAGGTDLLSEMKRGICEPECVVNLKSVPGLDGIRLGTDRALVIGALTKLSELAASPLVHEHHPMISQAAEKAATPQVRNVATLAGNLCQRPRCMYFRHPDHTCVRRDGKGCSAAGGQNRYHAIFGGHGCYMSHPSDLAPALIACDAEVSIAATDGRRVVPVGEFFMPPAEDPSRETVLGSAEVVTEVSVPAAPEGSAGLFLKASERKTTDFALASVAAAVTLEGGRASRARIAFGGVAPVPWRTPWAEECLLGEPLSEPAIRSACEAAVDGAKPLRENGYKVALVKGLLKKALERLREELPGQG